MMKELTAFAALILSAQVLSAQQFDIPSLNAVSIPEAASPAPAAPRAAAEWTIMVYMNGKNNLTGYTVKNLNEMESVGAPAGVNLVAEVGRGNFRAAAGDNWNGIRRYQVVKDGDPRKLGSKMLQEFDADMGDWNHLADFGLWAKQNFPAKHYMLIVWNHGDGWRSRGISYDQATGRQISGVELGRALARMGGVDVYASDACLMQMAEVIYELKGGAGVIVGSEQVEPAEGWDYSYFLKNLQRGQLTAESIGRAAVDAYSSNYGGARDTTISAVRTARLSEFRALTDAWADAAMKADKKAVRGALRFALSFETDTSRDMMDFMALAADGAGSPALTDATAKAAAFYRDNVLIASYAGAGMERAQGLAVNVPNFSFSSGYADLAWAKEGRWDDFVKWLIAK